MKFFNNKQLPNPWYLLTNLENKLEGSQANQQRLTNLILLIALAYTASCLVGLNIRNNVLADSVKFPQCKDFRDYSLRKWQKRDNI